MKKNYLKPEIETAPLLLNVGIMSAPGEITFEEISNNPGASGPPIPKQLPPKVF